MKQGRKDTINKSKIPSNKAIERRTSRENKEKEELNMDHNNGEQSMADIKNQAKQLKREFQQKQFQLMNIDKMYRLETLKNEKYKDKVNEAQKYCQTFRIKMAQRLIAMYKDNKDSPLFYNQNGLSPYELMLLNYSRNDNYIENICMVCFLEIEPNSHIVKLPCQHFLHKDCGMQHLLYSKECPSCGKMIQFQPIPKKTELPK